MLEKRLSKVETETGRTTNKFYKGIHIVKLILLTFFQKANSCFRQIYTFALFHFSFHGMSLYDFFER